MWTAFAVIVISFVGVVLISTSVTLGFTFLILPIVLAELLLLAAVFLVRQGFGSEEPAPERQFGWQAVMQSPPWADRREERTPVHPSLPGSRRVASPLPAGRR